MKVLAFIFWLTMFSAAFAATPLRVPTVNDRNFSWMKEDFFKQEKSAANTRAKRSIASSELNDQMLSPMFQKIKNSEELKIFITELDSNYDSYPDDLKLMTAMLTPLLKFKAFTYKMYPFVSQEKLTNSVVLTQFKNFASFQSMNLPTKAWRAGFNFVTVPSEEDDLKRFSTSQDIQIFLANEIYPAYLTAATRIKQLDFSKNTVVWDNQIFYGNASFSDNLNRYQLIGEAEKYSILAALHFSLADICKSISYNVDDILPFIAEVAKLHGYDTFKFTVDGISAENLKNIFMLPRFSKLFTIFGNGQDNINTSFKHVVEGSRNLNIAWTELRDRDDKNQAFIRSAMFTPFSQVIEKQIEGMESVIRGKTTIRSDVTGEMIVVDLPAFYAHAPKDLKLLLPTGFDTSPHITDYKVKMKNGQTKNVKFRNYHSGRATLWNVSEYQTLFPELRNGSYIDQTMKILNQSVYGGIVGSVIQPFMLY